MERNMFNYYEDDPEDGMEYSGISQFLGWNDPDISLQNLCLKSITNNFDRFNTAYSTSKDTTMRKNLQYLQMVHSDYMMAKMKRKITDSCLDFLLHEHLKELHLDMLCNCSERAVVKRLSEIGHVFVKGHLYYSSVYCKFHESPPLTKIVVVFLPNVQILHVPEFCNDEILKLIASSCPKLEELHIDINRVTDDGVKNLFMEKDGVFQVKCHLKVLTLKATEVKAPGIRFLLENMPSLQTLTYPNLPLVLYSMHEEGMRNHTMNPDKEYNLTSLDLTNSARHADQASILSVCARLCPRVKSLCSPVSRENDLHSISLFSELEDLSLDGFGLVYLNLNELLRLRGGKLKQLKLSCFTLSASVLLQSCPKLESLSLNNIAFEGEDKAGNIPWMDQMRKLVLERLIFRKPCVQISVATILNSIPKLKRLGMAFCEFAGSRMHATLDTFFANDTLQELHFMRSDVNAVSLESALLNCSSLRTLVIQDCDSIVATNIHIFYEIIYSKRHMVNIIWSEDRSTTDYDTEDDF